MTKEEKIIASFKKLYGNVPAEAVACAHCYGLAVFEVDGINILVGDKNEVPQAIIRSEEEVQGTDIRPILHRMHKVDLGHGLTGFTWDIPMTKRA